MPIHTLYDTENPQHICDGPWGGPNWHGEWTSAWIVGLEPKPTGDSRGPYHRGSVVQRGADRWERIWDERIQAWRSFTPDELAKLPPCPKNDDEWVRLKGDGYKRYDT